MASNPSFGPRLIIPSSRPRPLPALPGWGLRFSRPRSASNYSPSRRSSRSKRRSTAPSPRLKKRELTAQKPNSLLKSPPYWQIRSAGSTEQGGIVSPDAEGTCIFVSPAWVLDVTAENGASLMVTAGAGQFSGETPLSLAIDRDDDGAVSVVEGQPAGGLTLARWAAPQTDPLPYARFTRRPTKGEDE